ncbi:MAG TPA: response regulator transcription factor [Saprospiraceae bacterium]|jgi:DNA-binding NarL/FixJ family response regulator|nr:response regulator transcription factor [Saprospiraceae bacterium]HRG40957.1 response regulator transcription factor [Saprospiraceae bacterium]
MNILIYDDHEFVTEAIESYFLKQSHEIKLVRKHNVSDTLAYLHDNDVEIIISDLLSDEDVGFSLFEQVFHLYPHIKIIVYTSVTNEFIKDMLLEMGVTEIINKKEPLNSLWNSVQTLCQNITRPTKKTNAKLVKLTKKEKEIALLLAKGLSAKEIADLLSSSVNTINNQKNNLLDKFGCTNSTELIVKLAQSGLITLL